MIKSNTKIIGILVLFVFVIIFVWSFSFLDSEGVKSFVEKMGVWGLLVIFVYYVIADVVAPLAASPATLLGIVLYGFPLTLFSVYLSSLVSAIICFYISKKYGRGLVSRLVGKAGMVKIDNFVRKSGMMLLVFGRVFGGTVNELLSYAFGLTEMSFKRYFLVTVLFSWWPYVLMFLLFSVFDCSPEQMVGIWIVGVVLLALIFSFVVARFIKSRNE